MAFGIIFPPEIPKHVRHFHSNPPLPPRLVPLHAFIFFFLFLKFLLSQLPADLKSES